MIGASTGLYSVRRRCYGPASGRWIERDPFVTAHMYDVTLADDSFGTLYALDVMRSASYPMEFSGLKPLLQPVLSTSQSSGLNNQYCYGESAPAAVSDPMGLIPPQLAGCLAGGAVSGAVTSVKCWFRGEKSCLRKAACAAAGGCVAGVIASTIPGVGTACLAGALGSTVEALCNMLLGGEPFDKCTIADIIIGGVTGCLAGSASDWKTAGDSIRSAVAGLFPSLFSGCARDFNNALPGRNVCRIR